MAIASALLEVIIAFDRTQMQINHLTNIVCKLFLSWNASIDKNLASVLIFELML